VELEDGRRYIYERRRYYVKGTDNTYKKKYNMCYKKVGRKMNGEGRQGKEDIYRRHGIWRGGRKKVG